MLRQVLSTFSGAVTGWAGLIRVDNATYIWMGAPTGTTLAVTQTAFEYTSTRSIFTLNVNGTVQMKVTFLSPVSPDDLLRASLPYSYMEVDVQSIDGSTHDVQLYTDISAGKRESKGPNQSWGQADTDLVEWVSGDRSATAQWNYGVIQDEYSPQSWPSPSKPSWPTSHPPKTYGTRTDFGTPSSVTHAVVYTHAPGQGHRPAHDGSRPTFPHRPWNPPHNPSTGGVAYHQVFRQEQLEFSEINQQTEYGNWYYATENVASLTHQSGADVDVRGEFIDNGYLANTADADYRAINDRYPVFGFSKDLGAVGASLQSTLFQLSLHQKNAVQFLGADSVQPVASLWTSYFQNDTQAVRLYSLVGAGRCY